MATEPPASRLLKEWFQAFNAVDFKAIDAFWAAHLPGRSRPPHEPFRRMTGGFVIERIEQSSPTAALAIIKEQNSEQFARATLELDPLDPNHALAFDIRAGPTPDEFLTPEQPRLQAIDAPGRAAVIERIAEVLARTYVDAGKAKTMAAALRAHLARGDYDQLVDGPGFAARLTDDLHEARARCAEAGPIHGQTNPSRLRTQKAHDAPSQAALLELRRGLSITTACAGDRSWIKGGVPSW